jgi:hypothetical protein
MQEGNCDPPEHNYFTNSIDKTYRTTYYYLSNFIHCPLRFSKYTGACSSLQKLTRLLPESVLIHPEQQPCFLDVTEERAETTEPKIDSESQ